jgi:hypothetical protein
MTLIKKAAGLTAAVDDVRIDYRILLFFSVKAASICYAAMPANPFRGWA